MLFAAGLPRGFSKRDETSAGMSCGWQLSTQAACSTVSRAGPCQSSLKNCCCSSFMLHRRWLNLAGPASFGTQSPRNHQYIRFLQGAFAGPGGRWRARLGLVQGIQITFDTRDSNFRVLSAPSNGGLSALFLPNRGGHAPLKPEQRPCPQMPRRSHRPPVFSCVLVRGVSRKHGPSPLSNGKWTKRASPCWQS